MSLTVNSSKSQNLTNLNLLLVNFQMPQWYIALKFSVLLVIENQWFKVIMLA